MTRFIVIAFCFSLCNVSAATPQSQLLYACAAMLKVLKKITLFGFLPVIVLSAAGLIWLRFDAAQPQAEYFDSRQGQLAGVEILD